MRTSNWRMIAALCWGVTFSATPLLAQGLLSPVTGGQPGQIVNQTTGGLLNGQVPLNGVVPQQPVRPVLQTPGGVLRGTVPAVNQTLGNGLRTGTGVVGAPLNAVPQVNVGTRQILGGTQVNLGNLRVNLANPTYRPAHHWHSRWYNGYWAGNYYGWGGWGYGPGYGNDWGYGYGGPAFGYRPLGWGLGNWGLGTVAYNSGYLGYTNPYYTGSGYYADYDYAQPVMVSYASQPAGTASGNSQDALLDAAVAAFQQNDYDQALDLVNRGIKQYPNDAVMHEFRALVLFARGDYQQAAATIHSVLAAGPGWNWKTLTTIYVNVPTYTTQLRALEDFTQQNPQDAGSRFLLAYHYMVCGHQDAAARRLKDVVGLMPGDRVAADLLKMLTASQAPGAGNPAQPPTPQPAGPVTASVTRTPLDPAGLTGTWSASRDDGSQFSLTFNSDRRFTWKFTRKEVTQEFTGKYSIQDNVVALERQEGGSLVATVTMDGPQKFNFKLLGAPPDDPGLNFQR